MSIFAPINSTQNEIQKNSSKTKWGSLNGRLAIRN